MTVVANVKAGTLIDGMDEDLVAQSDEMSEQTGTPLNVNTGAIGANGTFSSINATRKEEHDKRIAIQRIVVRDGVERAYVEPFLVSSFKSVLTKPAFTH